MEKTTDKMQEWAGLAMASRLKRASDLGYAATNEIYQRCGVEFDSTCFPLFRLVLEREPLTLTEAAQVLGLSHAAISQKATAMEQAGWIDLQENPEDKRSKHMCLSKKGKGLAERMKPLWEIIQREQGEMIETLPAGFEHALNTLEGIYRDGVYVARVMKRWKELQRTRVKIHAFKPALAKDFERINREWISEFFEIEPWDAEMLGKPKKYIIDKGGEIFFAELDGEIIGTVALFFDEHGVELTKMAVTGKARGTGAGRVLMNHAIEYAKSRGIERLYLLTNRKQQAAIIMYLSVGFVEIPLSDADRAKYKRANCKFELFLPVEGKKTKRRAA